MSSRLVALILGIGFLAAGIAGFIPALVTSGGDGAHGLLFGLFPVNALHNIVHLVFGLWGIATYFASGARLYLQSTAIIYAVVMIMGFIPGLDTVFELMPVHGHDIWLHAVLAAIAAFFGFKVETVTPVETRPASRL